MYIFVTTHTVPKFGQFKACYNNHSMYAFTPIAVSHQSSNALLHSYNQ
jgi:hypothetical protein